MVPLAGHRSFALPCEWFLATLGEESCLPRGSGAVLGWFRTEVGLPPQPPQAGHSLPHH